MELWDLYDGNGEPLHKTHTRGEPMPEGCYHQGVTIWTFNSEGKLLVTKRDASKQEYPLYWEVTAGSVLAGESVADGAARELREETSIVSDDLVYLGEHKGQTGFAHDFLARSDRAAEDLVLQPGETAAAKWVSLSDFEDMIREGVVAAPIARRYALRRAKLREIALG